MDERFAEEFTRMCKEEVSEACLFAMTHLLLRHTNKKHEQMSNDIEEVLKGIRSESKEIKKLKEMFNIVRSYDTELIKNLIDIESDAAEMLRGEGNERCNAPSRVEEQRRNIKEWWK